MSGDPVAKKKTGKRKLCSFLDTEATEVNLRASTSSQYYKYNILFKLDICHLISMILNNNRFLLLFLDRNLPKTTDPSKIKRSKPSATVSSASQRLYT